MRFVISILLVLTSLNAISNKFVEKMSYETKYRTAYNKAVNTNKLLMMVVSTKDCPWCRKLERQTLKKDDVNSLIKKRFIPLSVDKNKKNFPRNYDVKVVPTIFFINPKQNKVIKKVLGYKNKREFKKILAKVKVK